MALTLVDHLRVFAESVESSLASSSFSLVCSSFASSIVQAQGRSDVQLKEDLGQLFKSFPFNESENSQALYLTAIVAIFTRLHQANSSNLVDLFNGFLNEIAAPVLHPEGTNKDITQIQRQVLDFLNVISLWNDNIFATLAALAAGQVIYYSREDATARDAVHAIPRAGFDARNARVLAPQCALHLAAQLLASRKAQSTENLANEMFAPALSLISNESSSYRTLVSSILLPALLTETPQESRVQALWKKIEEMEKVGENLRPDVYRLLCQFYDSFFAAGTPLDLRNEDTFWNLVQRGLVHNDSLIRKRSSYLLKKAIHTSVQSKTAVDKAQFKWSPADSAQMQKIWDTFFLIYETLDEFNVHLVKPVWTQLDVLFASSDKISFSWVEVLLRKGLLLHTNVTVTKLLTLEFIGDAVAKSYSLPTHFLSSTLFTALDNASIYHPHTERVIRERVTPFYAYLLDHASISGEERVQRIQALVKRMSESVVWRWHAISLLSALSSLQPTPALGSAHLLYLKTFLINTVRREHHSVRRKMYSHLLRSLPNLTDYKNVTLASALRFLGLFPPVQFAPTTQTTAPTTSSLTTSHSEYPLNSQAVHKWLNNLFAGTPDSNLQVELTNAISEYLKSGVLQKTTTNDTTSDLTQARHTASTIARALLFLQSSNLSAILSPLVETLSKIYSHPYLSQGTAERALALLTEILDSSISKESRTIISSLIAPTIPEIISYIQLHVRSFTAESTSASSTDETPRTDILASSLCLLIPLASAHLREIATIFEEIASFLTKVASTGPSTAPPTFRDELAKASAAQYMAAIGPALRTPSLFANAQEATAYALRCAKGLIGAPLRRPTRGSSSELEARGWNLVVAAHSHDLWVALSFLLELVNQANDPQAKVVAQEVLKEVENALEVAIPTTVGPILRSLRLALVSQSEVDVDGLSRMLDQAWRVALEDEGYHSIASVLAEVFHSSLLLRPELSATSNSPLRVIFQKTLKEGETVMGVVNLLVALCCQVWFDVKTDPTIASLYLDELPGLITFGPIRKGDNADLDMTQDVTVGTLDEVTIYGTLPDVPTQDSFGRALLVSYVHKYMTTKKDSTQANHFMGQLIMTLLNVNASQEYSKKSDYMVNSLVHRKRIRLWQFTAAFVPFLPAEICDEVNSKIWKILENPNLLSVRRYTNIFVINWLGRFPAHLPSFITYLKQINLRADSVSSGIVIAGHILMSQKLEKEIAREIFFGLIQYSTSNHITIRCVAQSMIELISKNRTHLREVFPDIGSVDTFSFLEAIDWYLHNNQECAKNLQKQYAHLAGQLDPRTACTLSNLYHDIPLLERLNPGDIIPPKIFTELLSNTPIIVGPNWVTPTVEDISEDSEAAPLEGENLDFQKKILPWSSIELDDELARTVVRSRKRQSLILVATLIDKIPNLAGMTRTSEIFNIEALVVPNKKVENESLFQQISVTAEKWVPLVEVKEDALATYLKEKKNEGYTLLGVEQTAQSTNLPDFTFPEKSVLLMGREKEGIPTEYINLLDRCIEIPQLGVIRSLNVHVSASILVWEYTRQQLTKNK